MNKLAGVADLKAQQTNEDESERKSDEWAELRAKGRAAFVRHDSGGGIPYTRGKPVMQCLNCDSFLAGEKVINQHAKRCRRK